MEDTHQEAYVMARRAAKKNFEAALAGLLAGHREAIKEVEAYAAQKDRAFLIALSLTEKGARLDRDGFMAEKVVEAVCQDNMSLVERRFVERALGTERKND